VTALAVIAACLLCVVCVIAWAIAAAKRDGALAARTTALSQAEAQTIKNLKQREETDAAVNADPDLLARARSVMHHPVTK
jgi:Tfp pilus assembly protein PilN